MPAPLPPHPEHPDNKKRLSYLPSPKPTETPDPGGRPTTPNIIQLEFEFSPITGQGKWEFWQYPIHETYDDWEEFYRFIKIKLLKYLPGIGELDHLMDYVHNFQVVNVDLLKRDVYPVIPRPTGYVFNIEK